MIKDDNDDNDSGSGPEWGVDRGRERCRMSVPRDTAVICLICGHHHGSGDDVHDVDEVYIDHQNHFYKGPGQQHHHNHDKFDHLRWSSVPRCPAYQWTIEE